MTRRPFLATLVSSGLALLAGACASAPPAIPARSLALLDVSWTEGRFDPSAVVSGEEAATSQLARALLRQLARKGPDPVVDARGRNVRPADLGSDPEKTAALRAAAPADAYLAVRIVGCGAWPSSGQDIGGTAYWYAGECTTELQALAPDGSLLATVQETGRWNSPRRERLEGRRMQAETVVHAVDDAAERLAHRLRPGPSPR